MLETPAPAVPMVIGVDGGGTGVRAVLAGVDGCRHGVGSGGGANPISRGVGAAVLEIGRAVRAAVADADPARVRAVVLGLAGAGAYAVRGDLSLADVLGAAGLDCDWRLVSDIEVAFAGGTPRADGVVLIAGTGAVGGAISGNGLRRQVDGHGWLLGDDGSGFWLGRQALRAALAELDGRGPATALTAACCATYDVAAASDALSTARALVERVHAGAPVELAALAPLIFDAAAAGDPVAREIAEQAAALLVETAVAAATDPDGRSTDGDVVLAGGVLTRTGPVLDGVAAGVRGRLDRATSVCHDGAAGAAWLAIRSIDPSAPAAVHARLTGR